MALAEAVCPAEWRDRQRSGPDPAQWAPAEIGRLIRQHLPAAPASAAYGRQADELSAAQAELHQLPRQLQEAQALIAYQSQQLAEYAPAATEPPAPRPPTDIKVLEAVPTDRLDALLRVIATTGLARSDTLRSRLAEIWKVSPKSSRVGLVVRAAIHRQLVEAQPGTVEWPGPKMQRRGSSIVAMPSIHQDDALGAAGPLTRGSRTKPSTVGAGINPGRG